MHLCFTCTGKTTQSKDREIKKKAFSAFWLSCSGNPRNLGARICIDRSGALQAAAGFANSSSSSSCTEPKGRTRHHQPPLKKGAMKAQHGYPAAERLLDKHSSWKPANRGTEGFGFCRAGVEVSGLGKDRSFPHPPAVSLQSCEPPHGFQSHFFLWAVPGLAVLRTVICRLVLPPVTRGRSQSPWVWFGAAHVYSPRNLPSSSLA